MLFLKSKRADLYFWLELIVLILVVVLIMNHFKFFSQLAERFFGGEKDSASNYQVLVQKIQKTLKSPEIFAAETQFPYYIGDGYIVVGFNKGKEKSEAFLLEDSPNRPNVCAEKACLCLYKGKLSSEPVQCDLLENVDYVFTLYYGKVDKSFYKDCCFCKGSCKSDCAMTSIPKQDSCSSWTIGSDQVCDASSCKTASASKFIVPEAFYKNVVGQELKIPNENYQKINKNAVKYAYLFIYGKNDMYGWLKNTDFGVQNLYIEKYTESDTTKPDYKKTYLFVAYPDQSVLAHSEAMRLKYGKKTAKEYSDKIDSMLKQNDMKSAFDEALRYRTNYPLAQLSEDTYKRLSDYCVEQINSMKKDAAKSQELKDFLPNAAAIHNDYLRFYETDQKAQYIPLFLFRLGNIYLDYEDYKQAEASYTKFLEKYAGNDLTKNVSEKLMYVEILKASPLSPGETFDTAISRLKQIISQENELDKDKYAKAHYDLGSVYAVQWAKGLIDDSDNRISKELEIVFEKYPSSDYAASAAYRLGQVNEAFEATQEEYDWSCYYYNVVIDSYPGAKDSLSQDLPAKAKQRIDIIKKITKQPACSAFEGNEEEIPVQTSERKGCPLSGSYDETKGKKIVEKAEEYKDRYSALPYVWGGESEREGGFDCSGLVFSVFSDAGVCGFDQRLTARVYEQSGEPVLGKQYDSSELKPGDLIFIDWNRDNVVDHVAIYEGSDMIVDSSKGQNGIAERQMPAEYKKRMYSAKRYALTSATG